MGLYESVDDEVRRAAKAVAGVHDVSVDGVLDPAPDDLMCRQARTVLFACVDDLYRRHRESEETEAIHLFTAAEKALGRRRLWPQILPGVGDVHSELDAPDRTGETTLGNVVDVAYVLGLAFVADVGDWVGPDRLCAPQPLPTATLLRSTNSPDPVEIALLLRQPQMPGVVAEALLDRLDDLPRKTEFDRDLIVGIATAVAACDQAPAHVRVGAWAAGRHTA